MIIDADVWTLMIVNFPNFVGFVLLAWLMSVRVASVEKLLGKVLDRCLPEKDDQNGKTPP